MHETTTLECAKCKEGHLTFTWLSQITELEGEIDIEAWIEITHQTCGCVYDKEEQDSLCEKAEAKLIEAYNVWAESQNTDDDMVNVDIEHFFDKFE